MSAIAQRRTAAAAAIMMLFALMQFVVFAVNPQPASAAASSDYEFRFVNGSLFSGSTNGGEADITQHIIAYYGSEADVPFDLPETIHVSCSEVFPGGWESDNGAFPDPDLHTDWQIAGYRIDRVTGQTERSCGETVVDAQITVIKHTNPVTSNAFGFDLDGTIPPLPGTDGTDFGAFSDTQSVAGNGGSYTWSVDGGDYTLVETGLVDGYSLTSATCDGPYSLLAGGVSFDILGGESITCTFTNEAPEEPDPIEVSVSLSGSCVTETTASVSVAVSPSGAPVLYTVTAPGGATFDESASLPLSGPVGQWTVSAQLTNTDDYVFVDGGDADSITVSGAACEEPRRRTTTTTTAPAGAIGDLVWFDENQNGQQDDPGIEFPINGATVTLLAPNGTVLAQQVTGADGLYLFDELEAGNYRVEVCAEGADYTLPNALGVAEAVDSDFFPIADRLGCSMTALISLPAGVTDLTWDAGLVIQVEGIQIEPTTTTIEPVTVGTLPFTGFDVEDIVLLSMMALSAGALLLFAATLRDDEEMEARATVSGWSNR